MRKIISIIIVTYNSEEHIFDCINSILQYNDVGDALEIIIVDNCSKSVDALEYKINELYGNNVRFIRNVKNGGYGQGNNVGIIASAAPYVMIMNPDVRMCSPIFSKMVREFENNPSLAMAGMNQFVPYEGKGIPFYVSYRSPSWFFYIFPIFKLLNIYFKKYMCITGACLCLNKTLFKDIGLYDENIFMYSEEDDIHYRILKSGFDIKYYRNMYYYHLHKMRSNFDMNLKFLKADYCSKKYLDRRDGFPEGYCKKYYKTLFKQQSIKNKLLSLMGKENHEYKEYLNMCKRFIGQL